MKNSLYGVSILEGKHLVNRLRYKGRGRPRKTDYATPKEVEKQINQMRAQYLDYMKMRI